MSFGNRNRLHIHTSFTDDQMSTERSFLAIVYDYIIEYGTVLDTLLLLFIVAFIIYIARFIVRFVPALRS